MVTAAALALAACHRDDGPRSRGRERVGRAPAAVRGRRSADRDRVPLHASRRRCSRSRPTPGSSFTSSTPPEPFCGPTITSPCPRRPPGGTRPSSIGARCSCRARRRPAACTSRPACSPARTARASRRLPATPPPRPSTWRRHATICSSCSETAGTAPSVSRSGRPANGAGPRAMRVCRSGTRGATPCCGSSSISRWRRSDPRPRSCAPGRTSSPRFASIPGSRRIERVALPAARLGTAATVDLDLHVQPTFVPASTAGAGQPGHARARRARVQRLRGRRVARRVRGCGSSDPPART